MTAVIGLLKAGHKKEAASLFHVTSGRKRYSFR